MGLAIGDALGGFFEFSHGKLSRRVSERKPPVGIWHWTDDTHMALSLYSILRQQGTVDQYLFAQSLAHHYERSRGYGMATRATLQCIRKGESWETQAKTVFKGQGSYGNGCASRVPPVGAFFADDLPRAIAEARRSAPITHTHPEALAGTIAVSVATAYAWQIRNNSTPKRAAFLELIIPHVPTSTVQQKLIQARDLAADTPVTEAAAILGNGNPAIVQTTVPFALWCAGEQLTNYEEAIWLTLEGQGDCDTTCAIVGGVVIMHAADKGIPSEWQHACEPFPTWAFKEEIEA
jgi:ADP-ribosylglycohydrolase